MKIIKNYLNLGLEIPDIEYLKERKDEILIRFDCGCSLIDENFESIMRDSEDEFKYKCIEIKECENCILFNIPKNERKENIISFLKDNGLYDKSKIVYDNDRE